MQKQQDLIRKTRTALLNLISDLSAEELNKIPPGFNNNIIWNLAHLISTQESIFYLRAGLNLNISQEFFDAYKPGSKPEHHIGPEEIDKIKMLLCSSLDKLESDLQTDIFSAYKGWTTRYGAEINSKEDALNFLPFHEGLHMGSIMALKRMVRFENIA